jgi:hypothetical protein
MDWIGNLIIKNDCKLIKDAGLCGQWSVSLLFIFQEIGVPNLFTYHHPWALFAVREESLSIHAISCKAIRKIDETRPLFHA